MVTLQRRSATPPHHAWSGNRGCVVIYRRMTGGLWVPWSLRTLDALSLSPELGWMTIVLTVLKNSGFG